MTAELMTIEETDVSTAWAKAFLKVITRGVYELSPLVVTVTMDDDPAPEVDTIRTALDKCIREFRASNNENLKKIHTVHTVANTIFPYSYWNPNAANDAELLYDRFEKAWPRLKKCSQNKRGSYFRRLTAFRPKEVDVAPINQLQHVVDTYKSGNHRRSALQASIFDPAFDHTNSRQLGFPCLHQVSFAPVGHNGLSVTAFYSMQYIVDRAYGNYLGLCRLGEFMAKQLGLKLKRMTCVAAIAQRGTPGKGQLAGLAAEVESLTQKGEGAPE